MTTRGAVVLVVAFGPSSSPTFPRALAHAKRQATAIDEVEPDRWEARFRLETDGAVFSAAYRLVQMTSHWRATEIEVEGEPEAAWLASAMLQCARSWLRIQAGCGEAFFAGRPWPRCMICPLLDHKQAGLGGMGVVDVTAKKTSGDMVHVVDLERMVRDAERGEGGPPAH